MGGCWHTFTYEYLNSNGVWVSITSNNGYTTHVDAFNTTDFENPILTTAIRITLHRNNLATGIIEWRVMGF